MEVKWVIRPPDWFKNLYKSSVWHSDGGSILLTFDDGPGPQTPAIIDFLREHKLNAIFFVLPQQVAKYPETMPLYDAEHCTLGSHFANHRNHFWDSHERFEQSLQMGVEAIEQTTGRRITDVRAPFGRLRPDHLKVIDQMKMRHWFWTLNLLDYKNQAVDTILNRAKKHYENDDIVLLHDGENIAYDVVELLKKMLEIGFPLNTYS
jgi:peptidoglycan/xylan/chitin deacetylase (PgdA/CDA1 family)